MKRATYRAAGVDIDAGNALVERIAPLARATARAGADAGLGGFGGFFDLQAAGFKDPILVAAADGVGTKLRIALDTGRLDTVGADLVAMCVNDLLAQGAEPLFFLDYFATGELDVESAARVIAGIADACRLAGCALIGGETAEMPGIYTGTDFDLAGFAVGAAERDRLLTGQAVADGDVMLGLASSGVHSNGYSLVRHIVAGQGLNWEEPAPFAEGTPLGEALLTPTKIYAKACLAALSEEGVHGIAHITGGGLLENIPRAVAPGLCAALDAGAWSLPPVFQWLRRAGNLSSTEMIRTFNCGIGMVLIVDAGATDSIRRSLEDAGETVFLLGVLESSSEGAPRVRIDGMETAWPD